MVEPSICLQKSCHRLQRIHAQRLLETEILTLFVHKSYATRCEPFSDSGGATQAALNRSQDGRTRLVPHPRARKAADAHGASASKAARQSAQEALQRSLWADTEEDVRANGFKSSSTLQKAPIQIGVWLANWARKVLGTTGGDVRVIQGKEPGQSLVTLAYFSCHAGRASSWLGRQSGCARPLEGAALVG